MEWAVDDFLEPVDVRISVTDNGDTVHVTARQFHLMGAKESCVPIYFLDTDLPENSPWARTLTHSLYGNDAHYRLCQEAVLGKRPDLLLYDLDRLKEMPSKAGGIQIIYSGKAHPHDEDGKAKIRKIFSVRDALRGDVRIAYVLRREL